MPRFGRAVFGLPTIALVFSATVLGGSASAGPPRPGALVAFADCDQFTRHMRDLALARGSATELGLDDGVLATDVRTSDIRAAISGSPGQAGLVAAGIPSFAESGRPGDDLGRVSLSFSGRTLRVTDLSGPKPTALGSVRLPGGEDVGRQLLLAGDRALVIGPAEEPDRWAHTGPAPDPGYVAPPPDWTTDLTLIDLHDSRHPQVLGTEEISARFVSAYRSGRAIRVVLSTDAERRLPSVRAEGAAPARETVRTAKAADWLPVRQIRDAKGRSVSAGPLLGCENVHRPPEPAGMDLTSILTIDLRAKDALAKGSAFGILGSGDVVSASATRLYVATTVGWGTKEPPTGDGPHTRVHAFDISGTSTRYLASGSLARYVDGARSLSARDDVVRAVTTTRAPWLVGGSRGRQDHGVVALREQGGHLVRAGSVRGIGEGRSLGVIRWFDDLVAIAPSQKPPVYEFPNENAGPLTLVRLSDTSGPRVAGTLDLPSDTAYLQPIGNGRVISIGQRAVPNGSPRSMEIATLDLADLAHPRTLGFVSYGNGDWGTSIWLPTQRTIIAGGWITAESPCPGHVRCANAPVPTCLKAAGCKGLPEDQEISGWVALHVGADGRLRPSGWLASERLGMLPVGERLWGVLPDAVVRLDPRTLKPTARTTFSDERS